MPPKRKAAIAAAAPANPAGAKRRRHDVAAAEGLADASAAAADAALLNPTYTSILKGAMELKNSTGERNVVAPFLKLPSKKLYPDYYTIVPTPFTVSDIQRKLARGKYSDTSADEFVQDFELIYNNAKLYNDPQSWIVADALELLDYVQDEISAATRGPLAVLAAPVAAAAPATGASGPKLQLKLKSKIDESDLTVDDLPDAAATVLETVRDHKFPSLGVLSEPFLDDIDRDEYPDYFKVVKHPTSFNSMLAAVQRKGYFLHKKLVAENLQQFYADTQLIFSNAQLYNDPSLLIHQDLLKLQEFFEQQYAELAKRARVEPKLTLKIEKRGRKKKVVEEASEVPESANEAPEVKVDAAEPLAASDAEEDAAVAAVAESNAMGKTRREALVQLAFIQLTSLCSASSTVAHLASQPTDWQPLARFGEGKQMRHALFGPGLDAATTTLFEYKFPTRGYAHSLYAVTLPQESAFVTLRVALHQLLVSIRKPDVQYVNATSDEEFQCRLFLNDEEVHGGGEIVDGEEGLLNVQYELKLSQGLNMLAFEVKLAPALSKRVKQESGGDGASFEADETTGRFTRHQMQQIKMLWDVERVQFIVCN
jgi:chromatin structure-remodeling complex subunit RSC4